VTTLCVCSTVSPATCWNGCCKQVDVHICSFAWECESSEEYVRLTACEPPFLDRQLISGLATAAVIVLAAAMLA
jgi:hypothetical protein